MKSIYNLKPNLFYKDYSSKTNIISPFIEEGEFLDHRLPINRVYSIDNFEYLTDCNKELITIGKGGYGKLYLAKNKIDNKEYAIKYVSKKKMQTMGVDSSIIKREIDIHIRITHPRIIKLLSFLEDRYNFYLAMEYAPKGTLYQLIQQKKGMCENEAFYYFIQVASAIHFLHINGYAHRDIKPENILLDGNGGIKLCDFGWCVNVAKGERTTFCGTYEYMAPEMINDEYYDMGIDIWSLGVLLYEMIHGYSPFRANRFIKDAKKAQVEIFINIKNNNYMINKSISDECVDLIDKLLTTDTAKRIKIEELFLHPWVVNKEKEYFPNFKRFKEVKTSNNNIINSQIRKEKDIDCIKSLDIKSYNKLETKYNKELSENKEIMHNKEENERKYNNLPSSTKQIKNKSYCFVYTKGNSINNGVYFIQGQSGNKQNKDVLNKEKDKDKEKEKEKEKNNYEFNKIILTESNKDFINQNDKNDLNPKIVKKESESKNNFIYSINSKRKKINLPKVIRTEKKNEGTKIIQVKPYESQEIKSININFKEKTKIQHDEKNVQRNYSKPKTDKKTLIRVQRQELDDYLKRQKEINDLNLKMQKIKEKQELVINKLRKIEEKKKREESLQKIHDSQKSSTSYEYYSKNRSLKNQLSFLHSNKLKKDVGSYSIKRMVKVKEIEPKKNRFISLRERLKEKRSNSYQQILTEKSVENKIKNLLRDKRSKNKPSNIITKNINFINNENYNYKNINNNGEDDILSHKENFKRFRKMVVHLKKRNNFNINTEGNLYKSINTFGNNININNNKIPNDQHNFLNNRNNNNNNQSTKSNKAIQNIYYNTFYNCLFNNGQKNNNLSENKYFLHHNNNNVFEKKDNNNIKNKNELKSISSEKNFYKFKNVFKLDSNKKNIVPNKINKENEMGNYSTERKKGRLYKSSTSYEATQNKTEKNKLNYVYYYKNNLLNTGLIRSLSSKKGIKV